MQNPSSSNRPKTTKFDVMMLSEADIAFLNNEAPRAFDDEISFEFETVSDASYQPAPQEQTPSVPASYKNIAREPAAVVTTQESGGLIFSSVSETRIFKALPEQSSESIDDTLQKIIISEPLLTEEDLLFLVKKEYSGTAVINRRSLRQALSRNGLSTGYKRFQAYMAG